MHVLLTPTRATENVISEIGPCAGIESQRERCTTVRFLTVVFTPFVVPAAGSSSRLDVPYKSARCYDYGMENNLACTLTIIVIHVNIFRCIHHSYGS